MNHRLHRHMQESRIARCLIAGLAMLMCSATATATKIRADFAGEIIAGDSIFQGPGGESSTFSGFYIFDTENNPNTENNSPVFGAYDWLCYELTSPGSVVFNKTGISRPIEVANDNIGRDWYNVVGRRDTGVLYSLFLQDSTGTVFSDVSLPSSVDLSDFDAFVGFWRLTDDFVIDTKIGMLNSLIFTEVDTCDCGPPKDNGIPTPAALPAGLALLAGVVLRRRR